jgi:transposase
VLRIIWYVEVTGCRWKDVPHELGCCGETARVRLQAWEEGGVWDAVRLEMLTILNKQGKLDMNTVCVDSTVVRAFGGGEETGPNPVDRAKPGTKFTLAVDRHGVPVAIKVAGANQSDHHEMLPTVVNIPEIGGKPGRPKSHPDEVYADAGYDSEKNRQLLRLLGINPHIRYKNGEHGSHLGKVRWVVERTISWIKAMRRMRFDTIEAQSQSMLSRHSQLQSFASKSREKLSRSSFFIYEVFWQPLTYLALCLKFPVKLNLPEPVRIRA